VDYPISQLVPITDLSPEEIAAILDGLDLDESVVTGDNPVSALPVAYPEYEKQTFSNLWVSLGFQATF
jgi:hypothetical protein